MTARLWTLLIFVLTAAVSAQTGGLKIVVIEGEDGVNIIQQKTAVRPLVEVRDRNNLPVSGALVTFSIGGKAASFGGATTLTVATNAAGQAAVTSLTPSVAGAFQIQVSAAFQGQLATATIAQTNVLTAAQAAAASAAASGGTSGSAGGGAGGSAGGGAGGGASGAAGGAAGGGGLSATTIGIVGAAVGGGALAASQALKDEEPAGPSTFSGSFTGQVVSTIVGVETCVVTRTINGTMQIKLDSQSASSVSGTGEFGGTDTVISATCNGPTANGSFREPFTVTGTPLSLGFREQRTETRQADFDNTQTVTSITNVVFQGALSNGVITGTLTFDEKSETVGGRGGIVRESATGTFPITLR